jgi:cytochrome b561
LKHHRAIIALHWIMAILVAAAFAIILWREGLDDSDQQKWLLDVHRTIGLSVLALVGVRAVVRLIWGREPVVPLPPLMKLGSTLSHIALYAAMIALPLLGWAQSSAKARHFKLFDITLPSLVARDPDQADMLAEWHETLAWVLLAVIGLHAAAALWHHYVRKDGVLRSMMPGSARL